MVSPHTDLLNAMHTNLHPFRVQPLLLSGLNRLLLYQVAPENSRGSRSPSLTVKVLWNKHNSPAPSQPPKARLPRKYQAGTQIAKIHDYRDTLPAPRNPS